MFKRWRNTYDEIKAFKYTWVDITPVGIIRKRQEKSGKYSCIVEFSDGSNIYLSSWQQKTNAQILAIAQLHCDEINARNAKAELITKLQAFRAMLLDKIQELQA